MPDNDSKTKNQKPTTSDTGAAESRPEPVGSAPSRRSKKRKKKAKQALYRPVGGRKKKEKTQISVRIDSQVMDLLYVIAESKHQRITEVLEYAGLLAVKENLKEPLVTEQARFLVASATPDEQWLVTLFLCYLRKPSDSLSVFNSMDRETFKKKMYMIGIQPDFHELLSTFGVSSRDPRDVERGYRKDSLLYWRNQLVHGVAPPVEVLTEVLVGLGLSMPPVQLLTEVLTGLGLRMPV
jgi:uncharacterized protein (DUF4415 family)